MKQRNDIWTYLIITAISVLVWYWAAGETKLTRSLPPLRLDFVMSASAADADGWILDPASAAVTISAEGSQRAIRNAERIRRVAVDLAPGVGTKTINLFDELRQHPEIMETGVSVRSASPGTLEIEIDTRVSVPARVRPMLPGVQTVGEIVVSPPQVMLAMPGRLRPFYPDDPTVEAFIERRELDRLEPDVPHTIENVALRLPERLAEDSRLIITPAAVTLTLTIRSQIRELALEMPVRIKIAGAPEDSERVELEPKQLRDVTILARVELIEQIESGEAVVVALLHLKSSEKESRIQSKPVTCFLALLPDGTGIVIDARVGPEGETRPVVDVTVRDESPETP